MPDKIITLENLRVFKENLSKVAVTGEYEDIQNIPTYPTELEIRRMFRTEYSITATITNGSLEEVDPTIWSEETATVTIQPNEDYKLPSTITVNGDTGASGSGSGVTWSYDSTTGEVELSNPTGEVSIIAVCEADQPQLTGFDVDDTITQGNSILFDTSADVSTFLSNIVPNENDMVTLLSAEPEGGGSGSGGPILTAMNYGGVKMLLLQGITGSDMVGYSDTAITEQGIPQGWFGLTDGKYQLASGTYTITYVNTTATGWNGVFIGKETI